MDSRLSGAISGGKQKAKKLKDEEADKAEQKREADRKYHAKRMKEARKEWVTDGKIFEEIREAVAKGSTELTLGGLCGYRADSALAEVLNEVEGLRARHHSNEERVDDDGPLVEIDYVTVTWEK